MNKIRKLACFALLMLYTIYVKGRNMSEHSQAKFKHHFMTKSPHGKDIKF